MMLVVFFAGTNGFRHQCLFKTYSYQLPRPFLMGVSPLLRYLCDQGLRAKEVGCPKNGVAGSMIHEYFSWCFCIFLFFWVGVVVSWVVF